MLYYVSHDLKSIGKGFRVEKCFRCRIGLPHKYLSVKSKDPVLILGDESFSMDHTR